MLQRESSPDEFSYEVPITLTYVSTEDDLAIRQFAMAQNTTGKKKKGKKANAESGEANRNPHCE